MNEPRDLRVISNLRQWHPLSQDLLQIASRKERLLYGTFFYTKIGKKVDN
jgi:hypothetical protein